MTTVLTSWSPTKKHSDKERWICVYPAYINSKKTLKEGRKISKENCVENPTHQEIRDVLLAGGFLCGVENKLYPKERSKEILYRGRIRVELKHDDGTPVKPNYPTRDSVLQYIGTTIPKLKQRQNVRSTEPSTQAAAASSKAKGKKGRK